MTTVAKRTQQSLRGELLSREGTMIAEAEDIAEGNMSRAVKQGAAALPFGHCAPAQCNCVTALNEERIWRQPWH